MCNTVLISTQSITEFRQRLLQPIMPDRLSGGGGQSNQVAGVGEDVTVQRLTWEMDMSALR